MGKAIDITKVFEKYKGRWVAFKEDEKTVIVHGKTAKEALAKATANGYKSPILSRIPEELVTFIGLNLEGFREEGLLIPKSESRADSVRVM